MKEFITKNYKIFIPVILVIVLGLALIIYFNELKKNNYREKSTFGFYQYIMDTKKEFDMIVSTDRHNVVKEIITVNDSIVFDSTPIYYNEEKKVIFPSDISLVFPLQNGSQYKIMANSILEYKDYAYHLLTEDYDDVIEKCFFYDGNNTYFFIDKVTIAINDEKITLSPMSYVILNYQNSLEYYDYEKDSYTIKEINNEKIIITNDYLEVNVTDDYITRFGNDILLATDFDYLDTIDKIDD